MTISLRLSTVSALAMTALVAFGSSPATYAQQLEAVQLYSDAELIGMIRENSHLTRVRDTDRCQLTQDIRAQAEVEKRPAYQFLYGDMLAWNVCYERNEELGLRYMEIAAQQGLPEALEQLGRYYHQGRLVQQDKQRAVNYLREAASLGNLPAQLRLADMLIAGDASPFDLEQAYHWLHNAVSADKAKHQQIQRRLSGMAELMPERVIERAKRPLS